MEKNDRLNNDKQTRVEQQQLKFCIRCKIFLKLKAVLALFYILT